MSHDGFRFRRLHTNKMIISFYSATAHKRIIDKQEIRLATILPLARDIYMRAGRQWASVCGVECINHGAWIWNLSLGEVNTKALATTKQPRLAKLFWQYTAAVFWCVLHFAWRLHRVAMQFELVSDTSF